METAQYLNLLYMYTWVFKAFYEYRKYTSMLFLLRKSPQLRGGTPEVEESNIIWKSVTNRNVILSDALR